MSYRDLRNPVTSQTGRGKRASKRNESTTEIAAAVAAAVAIAMKNNN